MCWESGLGASDAAIGGRDLKGPKRSATILCEYEPRYWDAPVHAFSRDLYRNHVHRDHCHNRRIARRASRVSVQRCIAQNEPSQRINGSRFYMEDDTQIESARGSRILSGEIEPDRRYLIPRQYLE
jgi:hypothetical protein